MPEQIQHDANPASPLTLIRHKHNRSDRSDRAAKYGLLPSGVALRAANWTNCQQIAVKANLKCPGQSLRA
jgi:hypothetical protein